jgi:succinyl-diaminopimelate desuccinylase
MPALSGQNAGMPRYDLAARTLELVNVHSESRHEQALAELVAATVPLDLAHRDGSTLLYRTGDGDRPLVLLAGHLDTVPENGNLPGRIEDGAVHGLGASDMKGGLAVMIELARWIDAERPGLEVDLALLFFPREELPATESALPSVFATGLVDDAELVVVLEPTDNEIHAGCLGHLSADLVFEGVAAHSARPWTGVNAIEVAVRGLRPVLAHQPRDAVVEGLTFVEVLSVTRIEGGTAANVVPDLVRCTLSFRYAPDRTPAEAEAELRRAVGSESRLENLANSPPARVVVDTPLLRRLRDTGRFDVEPKQAWTPVAEFSANGLDAVNLGPGATRYAHKRDEQVDAAELERTFDALRRFLVTE